MANPIGLVLAGGTGRRMGRTKGDLTIGGRRLATRAAEELAPLCRGVLISLRPGSANPAPGYPGVEDRPPAGRGPLAGIDAGFAATEDADLLVLACDYPNVGTPMLERLLGAANEELAADLVVPVDAQGRDHPLVGLWRRRSAGKVRGALDGGRFRVAGILESLEVVRVGEPILGAGLDRALFNLNAAEDLGELTSDATNDGTTSGDDA